MKTTCITVERNYRIDNSDQYMKARFTHSVEPEENETAKEAGLRAIKELDEIFCIAYPHVEPYLNFHVVRQVNYSKDIQHENITNWKFTETRVPIEIKESVHQFDNITHSQEPTPKQTIEEQIQACTSISGEGGLYSWLLLANSNKKLKKLYEEKLKQLQEKELTHQKVNS